MFSNKKYVCLHHSEWLIWKLNLTCVMASDVYTHVFWYLHVHSTYVDIKLNNSSKMNHCFKKMTRYLDIYLANLSNSWIFLRMIFCWDSRWLGWWTPRWTRPCRSPPRSRRGRTAPWSCSRGPWSTAWCPGSGWSSRWRCSCKTQLKCVVTIINWEFENPPNVTAGKVLKLIFWTDAI